MLISKFLSQKFCKNETSGYFRYNSEFRKPNFSDFGKSTKFGKFCFLKGLIEYQSRGWSIGLSINYVTTLGLRNEVVVLKIREKMVEKFKVRVTSVTDFPSVSTKISVQETIL